MMKLLIKLIILCLIANLAYSTRTSSEVYSCGGFVKLHKNIDKSKINYENIKIKLYSTTHNRLLETTECSPNGYYFLPIYEKGNYYFEIEAPKGWSFKNKKIDLNFQNENQCNEDINFELDGFLVDGNIKSAKSCKIQDSGLGGIKVELISKKSDLKLTTETDDKGYYKFDTVLPSDYEVSASHPTFTFSKGSTQQISFKWDNYHVKESIQVDGFDLSGKILNENLPMKGVEFKLFKQGKLNKADAVIMSNDKGEFKFSGLECGSYTLVPEYTSSDTKYDISPKSLDVQLDTGGFQVSVPFMVLGFSVNGRVVNHAGEGVDGVSILVNGEPRTTTDQNGHYTLEKVSSGRVRIEGKKDHYQFEALANHPLSAGNVKIPDLKVKSYHLCGQVIAPKPPAGIKVNPREISLTSSKSTNKLLTDSNGRFCFEVLPGTYTVSVSLSASEKSKGLQFTTQSITTTITNKPQLEVIFSQSRSTIQGKVKLLKGTTAQDIPADLKVSLDCLSRSGEDTISTVPSISKSTGDVITFSFRDLLPGTYRISVDCEAWCWTEGIQQKTVEIQSNEETKEIEFQQQGFALEINSPNNLVTAHHNLQGSRIESINLKKGVNSFCLKQSGVHEFQFDSCFKFDKPSYQFSTSASNTNKRINLEIKEYLIQGKIQDPENSDSDFTFSVLKDDESGGVKVLNTVKAYPLADSKHYQYDYWAKFTGLPEVYKFQAHSSNKTLLFYPSHVQSKPATKDSCSPLLPEVQVRKGVFINGKVIPHIEGVEITANIGDDVVQRVLTNSDGHYQLGPLHDDQVYQLRAQKKGYNFHRKDPKLSNDFTAVELGTIQVNIYDATTRAPISGVVLSLSGEEGFRQNSLVHDITGNYTFQSLYPGNYFLKAFFKEYSLSPSSQTIEVTEGKNHIVTILATRVAFSSFGKVSGLNGLPQPSITIQAIAADGSIVDETTTNQEGFYALRGLSPNQTYQIKILDPKVDRSTPSFRSVVPGKEDIENINFVVVPHEGNFDLTGSFVYETSKEAPNRGILPVPIRVSLQTDDTPKQTLKSIEIQHSTFFDMGSVPKSKRNLYLLVEPVINKQQNRKSSVVASEITFKPKTIILEPLKENSIHLKIDLDFEKTSQLISGDNVSVPWFGIVMFILFIITCLYPSRVWNLILSIKNGKSSNKVWKKSKKSNEDDSFLPKELRSKKNK